MKKVFALIALLLPMTVMAQEGEKDTTIVIPQTENTLRLTAELSKFGYANKDALSLIMAARLSKQAGFTLEMREKENDEGTVPSTQGGQKVGQISLDPQKLLDDAKAMAHDDGVLLALIDDVNNHVRGAVGTQQYASSTVDAGSSDVYRVNFTAGKLAVVTMVGDGDTDLDLYIYDPNGNLVDSDTGNSDNCVCAWTPRVSGKYKIKIVNRGIVYNSYILRTNQ